MKQVLKQEKKRDRKKGKYEVMDLTEIKSRVE